MRKKEMALKYTFFFKDSPFESHVDFEDMLEQFYAKKGIGFEPISAIGGQRGEQMIRLFSLETERQIKTHDFAVRTRANYEATYGRTKKGLNG